ncbi:hypothetical protein TMEG_04014, partial [Mycobacterium tuberculosis SUMu005]
SAPFTSSSTFRRAGFGIRPVLRRRVLQLRCGWGVGVWECRRDGVGWLESGSVGVAGWGFGCFQRRHAAFGCAEFRLWHVGAVQHQRVGVGCAGVGVGFG